MTLWLFIIAALFFQEPATTDTALFQARQNHLNLYLIHCIYIIATIIDIYGGFFIGKWIQEKFKDTRFEKFSHKWADKIENFIGRKGEKFVLILLAVINFPWANAFLASWLKISFKNVLLYIFIGNCIWYGIEWGINLGLRSLIPDPHLALYAIAGTALLFSIFSKAVFNKLLK